MWLIDVVDPAKSTAPASARFVHPTPCSLLPEPEYSKVTLLDHLIVPVAHIASTGKTWKRD